MIELRAITIGGFREASLALRPGERCRLLLSSDDDQTLLVRLLLGTARPEAGSVALLGEDLARQTEAGALGLLSRIGLVWPGGGFISNLKVWENLLLPLWYHGEELAERREPEVLALLERLGMEPARFAGFLAALPASLPEHEQRFVGVVRAMLTDAEVMIYANLFDGLDAPTRDRLLAETARHHARRAGRVSLFVAGGVDGLPEPFDGISLRQQPDGRFGPWA